MNLKKLKTAWYPLCRSKDLGKHPKPSKLLGEPLVLVRLDNKSVHCFRDVCPHRLIPLSLGRVVNGRLQCGYHGWEFDGEGRLQNVPGISKRISEPVSEQKQQQQDQYQGLSEDVRQNTCQKSCQNLYNDPKQPLVKYPCHEQAGWIWVNLTQNKPPPTIPQRFQPQTGFDILMTFRTFEADFIHAIENFLDPVHTLFIHRGLIRNVGVQHLKYRQSHDEHGFTTHYTMVNKQNGLINKLFDPGVTVNIARFQFPGLASIAYCKGETVLFEVVLFFIPMDKGEVGMATNIYIAKHNKDKLPAWLKFGVMRPFIELVFYQDKKILATQLSAKNSANTLAGKPFADKNPYQSTSADLVIDHLVYLLADGAEGVDKVGDMVLDVD